MTSMMEFKFTQVCPCICHRSAALSCSQCTRQHVDSRFFVQRSGEIIDKSHENGCDEQHADNERCNAHCLLDEIDYDIDVRDYYQDLEFENYENDE